MPPPSTIVCSGFNPSVQHTIVPPKKPTAHPASSAGPVKNRLNKPNTTAGNVCRIHSPPSNYRFSAIELSRNSTKPSAPSFTTSDTVFATAASPAGLTAGFT